MKNKTLKILFLWILTIVVLGAVALWVYFIVKTYAYKTEIESIRSEISATASRESYLVSVKNVFRDMDDNIKFIENRFINESNIPVLVEFLENEARLFEIKADIGSINIDPLSKNATFKILRIRINGSGSWANLVSFVNSLDTMEYAARIERVNFSKVEKSSDWNVVIDISQNIR